VNTVEVKIRAAIRAEAATLREMRPLRLPPAPPEMPRPQAAVRTRRARRFRTWIGPVTAAAAVIALAISLVIVRDIPNGRSVPPAGPVPAVAGVPQYYVTLYTSAQPGGGAPAPCKIGSPPSECSEPATDLLVGDTFSGARLALVAPPVGSNFSGVAAAADDRTFVVDATAMTAAGAKTWFLLRIAPGTHSPARLAKLSIPALTGSIDGIALSGSGRELAVALQPPASGRETTSELRIYSVSTGRLLRAWSTEDPDAFGNDSYYAEQSRALTWIDGDRSVAFFASWTAEPAALTTAAARLEREAGLTRTEREKKLEELAKQYGGAASYMTWRRLDISAAGSDLMADSKVIRSWTTPVGDDESSSGCFGGWIQLISADGKTVMCSSVDLVRGTLRNPLSWRVAWLALSIPTGAVRTLYQAVDGPEVPFFDGLWASTSGDTLIVAWGIDSSTPRAHFGVLSHGTFHPIPAPPQAGAVAPSVTWLPRSPRARGESPRSVPDKFDLDLYRGQTGTGRREPAQWWAKPRLSGWRDAHGYRGATASG
jgi:hypothetical protein